MTATFAVLTAITNDYDTLKPFPEQDVANVDTVCFTDDPALQGPGWQRMIVEPCPSQPNRAAKRPKCLPWEYTDADIVVWIDGSIRVLSPAFVREVAAYAKPIGQFKHPDRDDVFDEADISIPMPKYFGEPIDSQRNHYRAEGHPRHWGLWAAGVIVRRRTPEVEAFGRTWLAEIDRWSFQDQISEPVALRAHDLYPETIPGYVFVDQNPWINYEGSLRH